MMRTRPTLSGPGPSPLLSKAAATIRVDLTHTASMLDLGSPRRPRALGPPCLVRPASLATMANQIVKIQLWDYRVNKNYSWDRFFFVGLFIPLGDATQEGKRKGRKEKNGPPTWMFPVPLTLLPLAFARQPSYSGLRASISRSLGILPSFPTGTLSVEIWALPRFASLETHARRSLPLPSQGQALLKLLLRN